MGVDSTHPEYERAAPQWSRARDVLGGEDAVKAAGERYLPRLDSQSEEEYAAYKARASFFGATARTLEEYLDLVFRRVPVVRCGEDLKSFAEDCDGWGSDLVSYARRVLAEVLAVGRAGSLVSWEGERPVATLWRAEDILNWKAERTARGVVLGELVLREDERVRVLKRVAVEENGAPVCGQELWRREGSEWVLEDRGSLKREGTPLPFIPFVFHGPRHSRPERDRLPLADIIAANLDHYRLDADFKHGAHFAALPTAWVSGFDKASPLRIGSSTAWVSELPGASAGFLEFSGTGLAHLERAMERVERRMALMGARMLDARVSTAGLTGPGVAEADLCGLGSIVASLNQSLTSVLGLADWWLHGGALEDSAAQVSFAMNTDLGARAMSGEEITAVVAAWRAGAISRETMLERLKRGEVLPDGRSVAQERALIHGKGGAG